jgi:hypothetical protein
MAIGAWREAACADAQWHAAQARQQHFIARLKRQVGQIQRWRGAALQPLISQRRGGWPLAAELNNPLAALDSH